MSTTFPNFMAQHGAALVSAGYHILPIQPGEKMPGVYAQGDWRVIGGWQQHCDRPNTDAEVEMWAAWPECAIGMACGYIVGCDIDVLDGATALAIEQMTRDTLGDTPLIRIGLSPKRMMIYRAEVPFPTRNRHPIQLLARGSQFVARAIHPDTGQPYAWPEQQPETVDIGRLPLVTQNQAMAWLDAAYEMVPEQMRPKTVIGNAPAGTAAGDPRGTRAAVESALRHLPNADLDRDSWVKIGMAIKGALGDAGRYVWLDWSRGSSKSGKSGKSDTAERKWHGFKPTGIGAGTLYYLAGNAGWKPPADVILNAAVAETAASDAPHPAAALLAEVAARRERGKAPEGRQASAQPVHLPALDVVNGSEWDGVPEPPREWLVPEWIPIGHTALLYADGGVGKTLLAMQLMAACSMGAPWLGLDTTRCPSVGLFSEDDTGELQRRLAGIVEHYQTGFGRMDGTWFMSGVGRDNVLAKIGRDGSVSTTDRWEQFRSVALEKGCRLAVVDTAATSFAGNENDRSHVTQFIGGVLSGLAQEMRGAVLLNAHPSRSGMAEGGGMDGGSTGWKASARSVLTLEMPLDADKKPIPGERRLTRRKANYAVSGVSLDLVWVGRALGIKPQRTEAEMLSAASQPDPPPSGREGECLSYAVRQLAALVKGGAEVSRNSNSPSSLAKKLADKRKLGQFSRHDINNAVDLGCQPGGPIEVYDGAGRSDRSARLIKPRHLYGPLAAPEGAASVALH